MPGIPKLFHWIWLGKRELPQVFDIWRKRWLELNPGYRSMVWQGGKYMIAGREADMIRASCHVSQQSNILRYVALRDFGGIYLDCDMEPVRPIGDLLDGYDLVVERALPPHPDFLQSAFIACTAHHPAAEALVDLLGERDPAKHGSLGPSYLSEVAGQFTGCPGSRILDGTRFHALNRYQLAQNAPYPDTAIGIHHWSHVSTGSFAPLRHL